MSQSFINKPMVKPRDRIILAAWDLFHQNGIDSTSIDEILKQSNTGKSQFYHYFKNKDGLVSDMLEEARKMIRQGEIKGYEKPIKSWDDLRLWFDSYIEKIKYFNFCRSCPLGKFASELSADDDKLRKEVLLLFEEKKQLLKSFFIRCQAQGEIDESIDINALADFCESVVQGSTLLSKLHRDEDTMNNIIEHAFSYLISLKQ